MILSTIRAYRAEFGAARLAGECIAVMGFVVAFVFAGVVL